MPLLFHMKAHKVLGVNPDVLLILLIVNLFIFVEIDCEVFHGEITASLIKVIYV